MTTKSGVKKKSVKKVAKDKPEKSSSAASASKAVKKKAVRRTTRQTEALQNLSRDELEQLSRAEFYVGDIAKQADEDLSAEISEKATDWRMVMTGGAGGDIARNRAMQDIRRHGGELREGASWQEGIAEAERLLGLIEPPRVEQKRKTLNDAIKALKNYGKQALLRPPKLELTSC